MQRKGFEANKFREVIPVYNFNLEEEETELCEGCNEEVPLSEMSEVMEMYICNKCEAFL
jgi:hypothetical protein